MALKNRIRIGTTLPIDLNDDLDKLAEKTRINKSKLVEEAIEDLIKKYKKDKGE